ncbi:hypothetical protein PZH32_07480 [Adlercreutzia equolifaciens]|uniref:hypothetical protein n=1 Tax=Adlercreutzia equolifaciens TaxID=446660 RepID=UPI0023AF469E|nr:hypothetical protein [Adlercreutzia equolifaciens]MDE8702805.1 hypothetical protein [Adlercreutzia equolifaciens]
MTALLFALIATTLMGLSTATGGPDDDLGIAMVLSTLYPDAGQCPFTNAALNNLVYGLNTALPALNWTLVIERLSAAAALGALTYGLLRSLPRGFALAVLGFVLLLIYPSCTVNANFTVVAALCVFAGETLLCLSILRQRTGQGVLGAALTILGFLWRPSILLLSAPFLALAFLVAACHLRRLGDPWRSWLPRALLLLLGLALAAGCLSLYHQSVWSEEPWSAWLAYSDARSLLCDYPVKPYEAIAEQLSALGVSENDYWCMTHWITADSSFFTTERLEAVAAVASNAQVITPLAALTAEGASLLKSNLLLTLGIGIVAVVAALAGGRGAAAVAVLSLGAAFLVCLYFRITGRLPERVEYPIWLLGFLPLLALLALPDRPSLPGPAAATTAPHRRAPSPRLARAGTALGLLAGTASVVAALVLFAPTVDFQRIDQLQQTSAFAEEQSLVQHFSQGDDLYVWAPNAYVFVERQLQYRFLPPQRFMDHNVLAGGWTQGSPLIAAQNARLDLANPLQSLLANPHARLVAKNSETVQHVLTFLREHYDAHAKKKTLERIDVDSRKRLRVVQFIPSS